MTIVPGRSTHRSLGYAGEPVLAGAPRAWAGFTPWVAAALIVVWRLVALSRHGDPVGVDMGNWVRIGRSWLGDVGVSDAVYPPIVPAVATVVDVLIGQLWTSRLLQALAGVAPGLGVWSVLRTRVRPGWAIGASLVVALAAPTSAAVAWGGVPQLLGLGLFPVAVDRVRRWASEPTTSRAWRAGLVLVATGLVSTLMFGLSILAALMAGALAAAGRRGLPVERRRWGQGLAVMGATLAVLLPWYIPIFLRQRLPDDRVSSLRGGSAIGDVLGWPIAVWVLFAVLSLLGVLIARAAGGTWWATAAGCWGTAVVAVAATETRLLFVVPSCVVIGVGSIGALRSGGLSASSPSPGAEVRARSIDRRDRVAGVQRWSAGPLLIALAIVAVVAPARLDEQIEYYERFTPEGTIAATEWLAGRAGADELVVSAPVEGVPTGWWVEAAGVDAWVASRPDWIFFPEERAEAGRAASLLSGVGWPNDAAIAALRACGVTWLYLPSGWGGIDAEALGQATAAGELEVAFEGPGATIVLVLTDRDLPVTDLSCPFA